MDDSAPQTHKEFLFFPLLFSFTFSLFIQKNENSDALTGHNSYIILHFSVIVLKVASMMLSLYEMLDTMGM